MIRHFLFPFLLLFSLLIPPSQLSAATSTIYSSAKSEDAYQRVAAKLDSKMEEKGCSLGDPVYIRIFKKEKRLEVWLRKGLTYTFFKSYSICHHSGELGPKLKEGDKQSPEGFYSVGARQLNPNSDYHLSFNLGFPNEYDRSHRRTGSLLMVHGRCSSAGCFAMTNFRMDEIYAIVESAIIAGQHQVPVHIFPFKMTWANMAAHHNSKWIRFWENLKEGYDYFEGHHAPPLVTVEDKRYNFLTYRSLLFGGNLPAPLEEKRYVGIKERDRKTETL
ncbi:MAG: murein L,D-transpeptidase family protein [Thermodesulfobacteriota bacterium]